MAHWLMKSEPESYSWQDLVRDGGTGQTSYVLQDESGKITHVVTPAPGVNLHRYLQSKVGLVGQRGYHKQFQLDHVTAERVVRRIGRAAASADDLIAQATTPARAPSAVMPPQSIGAGSPHALPKGQTRATTRTIAP